MGPSCAPGQAVHEAGFITIGGIEQWVVVDGADCGNPVVVMVHGGPGNPNTPFARNIFRDWENDFTLVQWDQRGSGKTYSANRPAEDEPLTLHDLTTDGVEVTRYAIQRFGKRKVILMGGSWGSALAAHMAIAAPDLFHAYVGTSQLVNYQEDLRVGYARTLALATAAGDSDAVARLEEIGAPPWANPRASGALRRISRKYEALVSEPAPSGWFAFGPGYDTPAYEADYEAGEDYSFLAFVGPANDGMGSGIDLRGLGLSFPMPVWMLQGEEDLVTPASVSRAYFDDLSAPRKIYVSLPRTGHDPNRIMIAAQYEALTQARPEAVAMDGR
ncbi:alpha/beta hydrolase [Brevundimonas sp.]|uniref:alpha/beta fold hydrolase n=1 Tax=Brevundimonas sp. TaxID=1871086 RepID=UPI0019CABABD|nr:alpha/beta hydrolase [Brevundimonas sp.]MBD3835365.1 alpha/beta hydrolase [Brevundimonas sp.]